LAVSEAEVRRRANLGDLAALIEDFLIADEQRGYTEQLRFLGLTE
jgi:hypothetical protein